MVRVKSLATVALSVLFTAVLAADTEKPNIMFIFTDDQDARMDSLDYMPNLQKYLVEQGTLYTNHYATVAICCPSRVSLLRGQHAHNTNITHVMAPYGGYGRFHELGLGDEYLPVWMQQAGYSTHYVGKLMNEITVENYNKPIPKGFDYQDQLLDPYTYIYNSPVFSRNGEAPVYYENQYQTDIIHAKALAALKAQRDSEKPFFLWVSPMAPHMQFTWDVNGTTRTEAPVPAARHAHLFPDVKVPRKPHFNPDIQPKTASFWKDLEKLDDEAVDLVDKVYRHRLQALQAVDEMIGSLFEELEAQGKLDNTYVFYSADNGYHLGHYRAQAGKCENIEEDINVPFLARGPGIPKNHTSHAVSSHTDLASTFLALAKSDHLIPSWVDGGVLPLTTELLGHPRQASKETVAVEFWGLHGEEYHDEMFDPTHKNTYKTLRIISEDYNFMYAVWCTGDRELYELNSDPYELVNLFEASEGVNDALVDRLDALLSVLKTCRAESCRQPWRILHPDDPTVNSLSDALQAKYDSHYHQFRRVSFEECIEYFAAENESPLEHPALNVSALSVGGVETTSRLLLQDGSNQQFFHQEEHQKVQASAEEKQKAARLMHLVPQSDSPVGQSMPDVETVETLAKPVPEELLSGGINWSRYGFYSRFGN